MNIAFLYNVKHPKPSDQLSKETELDFDAPETISAISETIQSLGHTVVPIEADQNAFDSLKNRSGEIDLVFNIAEGLHGDARESQIPLFCEILKIPYTHSSPTTHAISLNKRFTSLLVKGAGVIVPDSVVFLASSTSIFNSNKHLTAPSFTRTARSPNASDSLKAAESLNASESQKVLDSVKAVESQVRNLKFPVIIKPNCEGSSIGVFDANIVDSAPDLKKRLAELIKGGLTVSLLIEEFIDGREFTVGVLGNDPPKVLPIIEQKFDFMPPNLHKIAGFELKWVYEDSLKDLTEAYDCPAKLEKSDEKLVTDTTLKVYETLNIKDCARVDYRMSKEGVLYFLEVNTLPGINPDEDIISYFPLAARIGGLNFKKLIETIILSAAERSKIV